MLNERMNTAARALETLHTLKHLTIRICLSRMGMLRDWNIPIVKWIRFR